MSIKKNIKLSKEEKNILKLVEGSMFVPVKHLKRDITEYSKIARATSAKNKTISIRISGVDLMKLKARAIKEGMPYQTLISSSIHRLTR